MQDIVFPTLYETFFLVPMTILAIFACVPLTIKVLNGNKEPSNILTLIISLFGVALSAVAVVVAGPGIGPVFAKALIFDKMAIYSDLAVLGITALTLLLSSSGVNTKGASFAEHVFLILLSAVGMLTLTSSNDLIVSFIGLETMSIALYVLIGLGHEQQFSKEAAFKYFILGSFASAIFLYGIALIFGSTGSTTISSLGLQGMILEAKNGLLITGIILLLVGIGFKVSLFPFHAWTPDVYQGAPTSVSGFMATGVKVVMFTLFLRLAMTHVFLSEPKIISILQVIAVLTMTVGNITAIVQENIKRMIAYSSIAHAGYILIGVIAACTSKTPEAASATLFYLVGYSVMNLGAFAVVNVFEKEERGNLSIMDYSGLGYKYPLLGVGLAVFMFSLAGIPPTVGFMGKFYIFAAAMKGGYFGLVILGVINSLLSAYYYLKVLVALYMKEEVFEVRPQVGKASRFVVFATLILALVMGILSAPFYGPALTGISNILALH
jgi:NADH-quinone oxidoreductase subunit N